MCSGVGAGEYVLHEAIRTCVKRVLLQKGIRPNVNVNELTIGQTIVSANGEQFVVRNLYRRDPNCPVRLVEVESNLFGDNRLLDQDDLESYGPGPWSPDGDSDGDGDTGAEAEDSLGDEDCTGE